MFVISYQSAIKDLGKQLVAIQQQQNLRQNPNYTPYKLLEEQLVNLYISE